MLGWAGAFNPQPRFQTAACCANGREQRYLPHRSEIFAPADPIASRTVSSTACDLPDQVDIESGQGAPKRTPNSSHAFARRRFSVIWRVQPTVLVQLSW